MTLLACQIFSTVSHEGSFVRAAQQLHLTPSAISHAVATMETECGFLLFTRTKNGVTMTAAAENLLPVIQRLLSANESLEQSVAQINGMQKGELRLAAFNSISVTWLPELLPKFEKEYPGISVHLAQGSYADIDAWLKNGSAELGFLSNSCAQDLDFESLYADPLVCLAPDTFYPATKNSVTAEELRGQTFVSQRSDTDADIQRYLKENDLRVNTRCYVIDDESTVAMVGCGQGAAILPELILKKTGTPPGCRILHLKPPACRTIGLACLDQHSLSPAAHQFRQMVRHYAAAHAE